VAADGSPGGHGPRRLAAGPLERDKLEAPEREAGVEGLFARGPEAPRQVCDGEEKGLLNHPPRTVCFTGISLSKEPLMGHEATPSQLYIEVCSKCVRGGGSFSVDRE
jgi:hypothetical protein